MIAMRTYSHEYNEYLPYQQVYQEPPNNTLFGSGAYKSDWMIALAPYVGGPSKDQMVNTAGSATSADAMMEVFQCPTTWAQGAWRNRGHCYGVNTFIISPHLWSADRAHGPAPVGLIEQIGRPDRMILIGDLYTYTPLRGAYWKNTLRFPDPTIQKSHIEKINWVFVDGHASSFSINPDAMTPETTSTQRNVDIALSDGSLWPSHLGMAW